MMVKGSKILLYNLQIEEEQQMKLIEEILRLYIELKSIKEQVTLIKCQLIKLKHISMNIRMKLMNQ